MPFGDGRLNSSKSTMLDLISIFSSFGVMRSSSKGKEKGKIVMTHGLQSGLSSESSIADPLDDGEEPPLSLVHDRFELLLPPLERDCFETIWL